MSTFLAIAIIVAFVLWSTTLTFIGWQLHAYREMSRDMREVRRNTEEARQAVHKLQPPDSAPQSAVAVDHDNTIELPQ